MSKEESPQNPLSDWLRLQSDFQARLADETLRYLRRLQGAAAPVTPGTVLVPEDGSELKANAKSGGSFEIALDVKNYQRVHAMAAPALDPMVSSSGITWYPEAEFSPEFSLVAPDESIKFVVRVNVPAVLPSGTYIGALSLRGLRQQIFRISVDVGGSKAEDRQSRSSENKRVTAEKRGVKARTARSRQAKKS
jgi:hypothetical protein